MAKGGDDDRLTNLAMHQITFHFSCDPRGSWSSTKGSKRQEAQLDERVYQSEICKKAQARSPRRSLPVGTPKGAKGHPTYIQNVGKISIASFDLMIVRGRYEFNAIFAMLISPLAEMKLISQRYSCLDFDPSPGVAPLSVG